MIDPEKRNPNAAMGMTKHAYSLYSSARPASYRRSSRNLLYFHFASVFSSACQCLCGCDSVLVILILPYFYVSF